MDECGARSFMEDYEAYKDTRLYGLADLMAAEELGVLRLRRQPYLNLTGRGIIFGIADTGIDYTHPVFCYPDGRTRILAIWDQTMETSDISVPFGAVYDQEQINEALASENPLAFVPVTDLESHGTFAAGLAAGNEVEEESFTGMAPDAQIVVVKLRQAEKCLKKFWFVSEETPAYEESDLIAAVDFLIAFAQQRNQALVLYLGVSSSQGSHHLLLK